jgi:hypothetical protein
MSLSKEQKQGLQEISRQLKRIEELSVENNLDLDVFMSEYKDSGFAVYTTEKVEVNENAKKRKRVFEKSGKPKVEVNK